MGCGRVERRKRLLQQGAAREKVVVSAAARRVVWWRAWQSGQHAAGLVAVRNPSSVRGVAAASVFLVCVRLADAT